VYEFFRNSKGSSNEGLKGKGVIHVINKIIDSSASYGRSASAVEVLSKHTITKGSPKKENGDEYEDSLFFSQVLDWEICKQQKGWYLEQLHL
jgi:hypothetical protein